MIAYGGNMEGFLVNMIHLTKYVVRTTNKDHKSDERYKAASEKGCLA